LEEILNTTLDTVIIGGGAMGSAAAWALAARGRDVTLLEQFTPGHHKGASHGATRNLSLSYAEPEYVAMLAETLKLWAELEDESGERLLARTGVVNHGPDPRLGDFHAALNSAGLRADFVPLAEAGERWRGIRFDQQVLHMPDGGQLNPRRPFPPSSGLRQPGAPRSGTTPRWWTWRSWTTASGSPWRPAARVAAAQKAGPRWSLRRRR
jgi:sarcosine oxidase